MLIKEWNKKAGTIVRKGNISSVDNQLTLNGKDVLNVDLLIRSYCTRSNGKYIDVSNMKSKVQKFTGILVNVRNVKRSQN